MTTPTLKARPINEFLNSLIDGDRVKTIKADLCVICGMPAIEFNDQLSLKEYSISGLCQICQDKTFGTGE